jgi:hypothetical protein
MLVAIRCAWHVGNQAFGVAVMTANYKTPGLAGDMAAVTITVFEQQQRHVTTWRNNVTELL